MVLVAKPRNRQLHWKILRRILAKYDRCGIDRSCLGHFGLTLLVRVLLSLLILKKRTQVKGDWRCRYHRFSNLEVLCNRQSLALMQ